MGIRRSFPWAVSGVWPVCKHCRMAAPNSLKGLNGVKIHEEYFEKTYREATIRLKPRAANDGLDPCASAD